MGTSRVQCLHLLQETCTCFFSVPTISLSDLNLLLAVEEARKVDMYHTETSSLQGFYSTDWEGMQELLSSGPWSPAHSHVEQARNTLAFATRAKEVTNTTHINIVSSLRSHVPICCIRCTCRFQRKMTRFQKINDALQCPP